MKCPDPQDSDCDSTALDYFKLYLANDPENKPTWINDYKLFVKELLINFSPYNMIADAEVELEQLIMKDNHKATKFFVDFYQLASLLQHNNEALYQRAYLCYDPNLSMSTASYIWFSHNTRTLMILATLITPCYLLVLFILFVLVFP